MVVIQPLSTRLIKPNFSLRALPGILHPLRFVPSSPGLLRHRLWSLGVLQDFVDELLELAHHANDASSRTVLWQTSWFLDPSTKGVDAWTWATSTLGRRRWRMLFWTIIHPLWGKKMIPKLVCCCPCFLLTSVNLWTQALVTVLDAADWIISSCRRECFTWYDRKRTRHRKFRTTRCIRSLSFVVGNRDHRWWSPLQCLG